MKTYQFIFLFIIGILFSQQSARDISLGGSMVTLSRGVSTVGINPANLAFSKPTINLINLNTLFYNNLLSMKLYNDLNGSDLENPNSSITKKELIDVLNGSSFNLYNNLNLHIPGINYSNSRYAITAKLNQYNEIIAGNGLLRVLFFGNEWETESQIDIEAFSKTVIEYGYSSWFNLDGLAFGYTFKYLQGVNLFNIYTLNESKPLYTDSTGIDLSVILAKEIHLGGSGFGVDLGMLIEESLNGYSFGFSITNLFGYINWDKNNLNYSLLGKNVAQAMNLNVNEVEILEFKINNLNTADLMSESAELADSVVSNTSFNQILSSKVKTTNYPSVFRFGISKFFKDDFNLSYESRTGFESYGINSVNWIHSLGLEIIRWKLIPLRFGISSGSSLNHRFSFGSGIHIKPIKLDFGLSWIGSRSFYSANGLEFGFTLTLLN
ncbi:MAG: hypothetical protein CMF96_04905 [Candidatus Marinimicrobia bacterium]|nr:hypothetical protein [Candidatus Neomarinimicrobiota bacterium]